MSITTSTVGKKTYKIVLLGDSAAGKTSIIQRFVNNKFEFKDNPTIGIDFVGKNVNYKQNSCRLQLWDTAGQERYRSLIPSYLKDAICAIFVFDITRPETLQNIELWIDLFRQNRGQKTVMSLCANKIDLNEEYPKQKVKYLLQKYKMNLYLVSAKDGLNIQKMFHSIIDTILQVQQRKKKKFEEDRDIMPPLTTQNLKEDRDTLESSPSKKQEKVKLKKEQHEEEEQRKRWCC